MAQSPSTVNQPFERSHELSTDRYSYSPDLEDPCLIEAQDLLSQFIRTSTQEPRELVARGRAALRGALKGSINSRRGRRAGGTTHQQNYNKSSAPGWHQKRQHRKVGRPPKASYQQRATRESPPPKENQPSRRSSSSDMEPLSLKSRPTTPARRSGRPRSGPTNYYQNSIFEQLESDLETDGQPIRSVRLIRLPSSNILPSKPKAQARVGRAFPSHHLDALIRGRELGGPGNQKLHSNIMPDLKLSKSWKGASGDVIVSAWSPDGTRFVAGATTQCDEHNMEYNRGNNLVLGDLVTNSLRELPDHWEPRPPGRWNPNMTDSRLFMSVTAVQWFNDFLFTASYDNTVKVWDAATHANTYCLRTLKHASKVQVMSRSTSNPNILATGSHSIGLWDIGDNDRYTPLETARPYNRRDIELLPTSLAWGTMNATSHILVAGMSERDAPEDYGLPQSGLLAMWFAEEGRMNPVQPIPNSQNVFDIKWHPSLPVFATASALGQHRHSGTPKDARSVVRLYSPLTMKPCTHELDCPALDMNDITFCPLNPHYVTASCTDGATYVWDCRRPDQILHKLEHEPPSNQMDERMSREQADVGVRLAMWGDGMDQFYSGASDGVLKRWDILRSPDNVLVDDIVRFKEGIMCGAFSEDKANVLVGDETGGVHLLSSSPFPHPEEDRGMHFEGATEPERERKSQLDQDSGVAASRVLIESGELERHPICGVVQGARYTGPFGAWARPAGTPADLVPHTPLIPEMQLRQFDGPRVEDRRGLSEDLQIELKRRIQLAQIRNGQPKDKRKRNKEKANYINLVSEEEEERPERVIAPKKKKRSKKRSIPGPIITQVGSGVIDLTGDIDEEAEGKRLEEKRLQYDLAKLEEDLADDFWWPGSGEIDPNIQEDD